MKPLIPLLVCVLAVSSYAEPQGRPRSKGERNIRERVCAEGAYLRGPRAAAERLSGAERVQGGEPGGEDSGLFRFTPPKEGCEQAVGSFFSGAGAGFEIAPAFETGPGGARVELRPEEAAKRMVRLASLNRVATSDPNLATRFFDNKLNQGDVTSMAGLDATRGLPQAPGTMSYFVSDGQPRVPFTFTARPPRRGLTQDTVPAPGEPPTFQPASGTWEVPEAAQPRERGWRDTFADYSSQLRDWTAGSPIAREEGRPILPPATPVYPGDDSGIQTELLDAAGLSRRCKGRERCWGTGRMVDIITAAAGDYDRYVPQAPRIVVGDISKRGGGPISGHVSHQRGVDVDLMFHGTGRNWNVRAHSMIAAGIARRCPASGPGSLQYILVDQSLHSALRHGLQQLVREGVLDQAAAQRASAAIRHWPHHADHYHVRVH